MQIKTTNSHLTCWQKAKSFLPDSAGEFLGRPFTHCGNATDTSYMENDLSTEIPNMLIPNFTYSNFSNQHSYTWEQLLLYKSIPCIHVYSYTRLETVQTSTTIN